MASIGSQGNQDIDGLKARFSQMQQKQATQATTQPTAQNVAPPVQQQSSQVPQQVNQATNTSNVPTSTIPVQKIVPQQTQTPSQATSQQKDVHVPDGTKSPLDALQGAENKDSSQTPVNVVEVEGEDNAVVDQNVVPANIISGEKTVEQQNGATSQASDSSTAIQTKGQIVTDETIIEESLEDLREEYDDAKLNSVIIEQVKELIEIDNNLNNKLEDLRIDLKKEIEEREKLNKKIDSNYGELKELEKSIDKFIALYELVTNQFNPFVKQGDQGSQQQMQDLMKDMKSNQQHRQEGNQGEGQQQTVFPQSVPQQAVPSQAVQQQRVSLQTAQPLSSSQTSLPQSQTDFHFETKKGLRVNTLAQLVDVIQNMSDGEFSHHVTETKNDFATWIGSALQNVALAQKLMPLKTKQDILLGLQQNMTQQAAQPQSAGQQNPQ